METLTLQVPDISCQHCKTSIEGAVAALPGVASVTVNIEPRTVDLAIDAEAVALDDVVAAIEEQGYEVAG